MSAGLQQHRAVHSELDELVAREILTVGQAAQLKERYPITQWDFLGLVRSISVLGALTAAAGILVLLRDHINWWVVKEVTLFTAALGGIASGFRLKRMQRLPMVGETLELLGTIAWQGLTVVLAERFATGSNNWPALVGVDALQLFVLAYGLANPYVLWYACANFFFYFGASTGYESGWGAYYLGMTYPVRYLVIGVATLVLAGVHGQVIRGRWAPFTRVYIHFGLLSLNLSLWFLSLFGYYENMEVRWEGTGMERFMFSVLWALVSGASIYGSDRTGLQVLGKYGFTFLYINLYTFYFQFVAANTPEVWFLHLLIAGGSLLWLGSHLERQHGKAPATAEAPASDGKQPPAEP